MYRAYVLFSRSAMLESLYFYTALFSVADLMLVIFLIRFRRKRLCHYINLLFKEHLLGAEDYDFLKKEYCTKNDPFGVVKSLRLPRFENINTNARILKDYHSFRKRSLLLLRLGVGFIICIFILQAVIDLL